jgi:hypothetical protein
VGGLDFFLVFEYYFDLLVYHIQIFSIIWLCLCTSAIFSWFCMSQHGN